MKKKIFIAFFTLNLLGLVNSCECPDEKYFDYTGIQVTAMQVVIPENEVLNLDILQTGTYYLAQRRQHAHFGTAAYATTTCEKGYEGAKFTLTGISVKSDSDFSPDFPAGTELNTMVKAYGINATGDLVLDYLDQFPPGSVNFGFLTIEERPELDKSHRFTISLSKSNGSVVEGISGDVLWE